MQLLRNHAGSSDKKFNLQKNLLFLLLSFDNQNDKQRMTQMVKTKLNLVCLSFLAPNGEIRTDKDEYMKGNPKILTTIQLQMNTLLMLW